jgi:peptidoglycan/LPS O-acetylase OafA/YrhL
VAYPETILGRLLNTLALRFLGLLSYSLYLIHGVVIVQMENVIGNALLRGVVSFAISLSLALVVRALIERPLEKLRSRLRNGVPLPSLPESQSVALLTG